jgi:hypothetical protein
MGGRLVVELLDALAEICFRHGDAAPLQIFQTLSGGDALSLGAAQDSPSGIASAASITGKVRDQSPK